MTKRTPSAKPGNPKASTLAGQLKATADAMAGIPEPLPYTTLSEAAAEFWRGVMESRARDEWDAPSLALAAQLCECQHQIEEESAQLRVEGSVIDTKVGPKSNPRAKILEGLIRREMAMLRTLRLGGRAASDVRHLEPKRAAERSARSTMSQVIDDSDGLLA